MGYDPSPLAAFGARELGLDIKQAYFTEAELTCGPWDVAIATEVLEHLEHPPEFLALMRKAMADGGLLVLTTPDAEHITPCLLYTSLGADYLRRNPSARVLGIDVDDEAIAHARERISEVFCGDVEKTPMPFSVPEGIDCIVYGDVLEHLVDPWALLAEHAKYLSPQGTVLVCMPNVEHWSFAAKLLTGNFDYEDQGLFDHTHLRLSLIHI